MFVALDKLAEQVTAEAASTVNGDSGEVLDVLVDGKTAARDQMDHRSGGLLPARTHYHLDHQAHSAKHERAGQRLRIVDSDQPAVSHADPCSNKGRLGCPGTQDSNLSDPDNKEPAGQTVADSNKDYLGRFLTLSSNLSVDPEPVAAAWSAAIRQRTQSQRAAQRQKSAAKRTEPTIVQMYEQGQGIRPIAAALGINRSVVRRVLNQHDVPRRGPTLPDHRAHEIRRLYDSGLSIAALAARLGVGKTTLQRFMHRNGITTRDKHGRVRAVA